MTADDSQYEAGPAGGGGSGDPYYVYKPSMVGSPWEFALRERGLEWRIGRRSGLIGYDRIRRVRLSFRPMTMQSYRFLAEIWSADGPKLRIASTSWRNLVDQERHDAAYSAFLGELHRRLQAVASDAQFVAGTPAPLYWAGVLVFGGILVTMLVVAGRSLFRGDWLGAAVLTGLMALFGWQIGNFFRRNQPLRYRPDAVPEIVLPRPDGGFVLFRPPR